MEEVFNFHQLALNVGTSGQPTTVQFSDIAEANYAVVINMAMHDSDNAVPEEGNIVASLGMTYVHIPVPFDAPTANHLSKFFKIMDSFEGEKIFVHCVANFRVSAFMHQYLTLKKGIPSEQATSPVLRTWPPRMSDVWKSLLELKIGDIK